MLHNTSAGECGKLFWLFAFWVRLLVLLGVSLLTARPVP